RVAPVRRAARSMGGRRLSRGGSVHRLAQQLKHRAYPEVAAALRERAERIAGSWMEVVREVMPQMDRLTIVELRDDIPPILEAMAGALGSDDEGGLRNLRRHSSEHGFARFMTEHEIADIF